MPIDFTTPELTELKPKIMVIGVGGAGGNAINNMIAAGLKGVDFIAANTDAQALANSRAETRVQLGISQTRGLGAGARPEVGREAAEEVIEHIDELLNGANMVFVTAGMGGGTGTGAAPVIARAARERGILTVGVVTKPFLFEGRRRMRMADGGIEELQKNVDTLIIIPNQNLFRVANERTSFIEAFAMADEVLHSGVRGITDLMLAEGLINLDFADICTVMSEMGKAMMGTGEAEGDRRAIDAAEAAISNPLLDEVSLKGAKGVIINVTGGHDLSLMEIDEAVNHIADLVDPDANIIFGAALDENLEGRFRLTVVATGIEAQNAVGLEPAKATLRPDPLAEAVDAAPVAEADEAPVDMAVAARVAEAPEPVAPVLQAVDQRPSSIVATEPRPQDMRRDDEPLVDTAERPVLLREPVMPNRQSRPVAQKVAPPTPTLLNRMGFGRRADAEDGAAAEQPSVATLRQGDKQPSLGRIDPADRPAPPAPEREQDLQIPPFLYKVSN
ncbi:MAG: cell division protein FtsZ [Sphingomonadales bacterium]